MKILIIDEMPSSAFMADAIEVDAKVEIVEVKSSFNQQEFFEFLMKDFAAAFGVPLSLLKAGHKSTVDAGREKQPQLMLKDREEK